MFNLFIFLLLNIISCYVFQENNITLATEANEKTTVVFELDEDDDIDDIDGRAYIKEQERSLVNMIHRGFEDTDPQHHEHIVGNLGNLHYAFNDTTISGTKNCKVLKLGIVEQDFSIVKSIQIDVTCPLLRITGLYKVHGIFFIMPVEGTGDYIITAEDYSMSITCGLKRFLGKDNQYHYKIQNYSSKMRANGPVVYRYNNLYNGNQQLSDLFHSFANCNYKAVTDIVQDPLMYPTIKTILKKTNKYLKPLPIEDVVIEATKV